MVGERYVQVAARGDDTAPYERDYRKRSHHFARAVVFPANSLEVAQIVRYCADQKIPMIAQGGNTGLAMASTPSADHREIIINLTRLSRLRQIDAVNGSLIAEAGCLLQNLHEHAQNIGWMFPLSMASEGSCTIGGNMATNAGGTAVLAFGNARQLCLGLEWVNAEGEIIDDLRGLRKNNVGYALSSLLVGAEGTLGIITAICVKLFPLARFRQSIWLACADLHQVTRLFGALRTRLGEGLVGFEMMNREALALTHQHFPDLAIPFFSPAVAPALPNYSVLIETQSMATTWADEVIEAVARAVDSGYAKDAVIAQSAHEAQTMWRIRESIPLAQARQGLNVKHDISLPIGAIADFVYECQKQLLAYDPRLRLINFGHMGDGNLHFNVDSPALAGHQLDEEFEAIERVINTIVYECVLGFGGAISAEHGIGRLKSSWLVRSQSPAQTQAMLAIKSALDPHNLFNPAWRQLIEQARMR